MEQIRIKWEQFTKVPTEEKTYKCPKCKDTGFYGDYEKIYEDAAGNPMLFYRYAKRCDCVEKMVAKGRLERSGIPDDTEEMNFGTFNTRQLPVLRSAKDSAMKYADAFELIENDRNNSIIFCGQPGAGKTHLGISICHDLINRLGVNVIYMPYRNAVSTMKKNLMNDKDDYANDLLMYAKARLLFIDDLLKGKITESDVNIMYEIINYRYMHRLPMIISTEKLPADLVKWDDAIGSRIIEMCKGNIIELEGEKLNYRLSGLYE